MRKIVVACYSVCVIVALFFIFYATKHLSVDETNTRADDAVEIVMPYHRSEIKDARARRGNRKEYLIKLPKIEKSGKTLAFMINHHETQVYIGNHMVYERKLSQTNAGGKTLGNSWVTVSLYPEDTGKTARVLLTPLYDGMEDTGTCFYVGTEYNIWLDAVKKDIVPDILSIFAILIGLVFMIFILINFRNTEINRSLFFMGVFSICIGIWKFTDTDSCTLLLGDYPVLAYMPSIGLLLSIVPFAMFIRTMFYNREARIWYVLLFTSIGVNLITFISQFAGLADMRELLLVNHAVMVFMAVVAVIETIREKKKNGLGKKLKITIYCVSACIVGLIGDMIIYYSTNGTGAMGIGIFCFLTYVVVLGVNSVMESRALMARGEKAKKFEEMAYHDQLTGLLNRTAYAVDTEDSVKSEGCTVIMMDLNDLKICNDTKGHQAGDSYILNSVKLIKEVLGDVGKCYRLGGDEFCVLTWKLDYEECQRALDILEQKALQYNNEHTEEFPIKIASGFARFRPDSDFDFGDTLRRADRRMYRRKMEMKH